MSQPLKVGLVGATGVVGTTFCRLIEERNFPLAELRPFASSASAGKKLKCKEQEWTIQALSSGCFEGLDLVFFSSGDSISEEWAPQAAASGAYAIDNSAAFRMSDDHALVVPEVNGDLLADMKSAQVIANPNCSTIQLVVALKAFESFGLKSIRVATYQAVSGAGRDAMNELVEKSKLDVDTIKATKPDHFVRAINYNCVPEIGSFGEDLSCSEERKIRLETKKIMRQPSLPVSAFTVRCPSLNGHAEAVWVELEKDVDRAKVEECIQATPGLTYSESGGAPNYHTPLEIDGLDDVYLGRLRKDPEFTNTWTFWIAADNLKKGAALNGIQIAEMLFSV